MINFVKNNRTTTQAFVAVVVIATGLAMYLGWYVTPSNITETVKVIAVTDQGCVAESSDGFSVDIGPCDAEPGEFIEGTYDEKIKERRTLMNPTT